MSSIDYSAWEGFAVAEVGAAAVLTGLVFVAVSVNINKVIGVRGLPARAGETVILYLLVLVACSLLLVPGLSTDALGGWLLATGLLGWALLNVVVAAGWQLIADRDGSLYWLVAGTLLCLLAATGNAWVLLVEIVRDERDLPVEPEAR